jgi:hypothetical protein
MITTQSRSLSQFCASHALLCVLVLFTLHSTTHAAEVARPTPPGPLPGQQFFCSAGYDPRSCLQHAAQLKAVLLQYPPAQFGPWSWVIVRTADWQPFLERLRLDQRSPAFSALEQRSTFLEEALFEPDPRRAADLEDLFHTPARQLLAVAVAHELGHALCHEMDENVENRVAGQLLHGESADCRAAHGPTPIQELYLHRQPSGLHR